MSIDKSSVLPKGNSTKRFIKYLHNYPCRYRKGGKKMTLIIGAHFKDGVILVADRKVTEGDSGRFSYENKLTVPSFGTPLVFAAAGYSHKFKQFHREIAELIAQRLRETKIRNISYLINSGLNYEDYMVEQKGVEPRKLSNYELEEHEIEEQENYAEDVEDQDKIQPPFFYSMEDFIKDCKVLVKNVCSEADILRPQLEVLLTLFTAGARGQEARLHHISYFGEEEEVDYCAIGSGARYVDIFLKRFWRQDMNIEEILRLAFFCIYYVQDLKLDNSVGMEPNVPPDHLVITYDGNGFGTWGSIEEMKSKMIKEAKRNVKKFMKLIESLKPNFNSDPSSG